MSKKQTGQCTIASRLHDIDLAKVKRELDDNGWSALRAIIQPQEASSLASLYQEENGFRSRVAMARYGFGRGEYKYFSYPLPDLVSRLRTALYPHLVPIANHWNELMGIDVR